MMDQISRETKPRREPNCLKQGLRSGSAAFASSALGIVFYPFDVLKNRFQSHDGGSNKRNVIPKYGGVRDAFVTIFKREGIRGLYKGVIINFGLNNANTTLFFALYGILKPVMKNIIPGESKGVFIASVLSSQLASTCFHPLMVVRVRMVLNPSERVFGYENFIKNFKEVRMQHGVAGFFRGWTLSMLNSSSTGLNLTIYEGLKKITKYSSCLDLLRDCLEPT
eukprot:TRINITY_DN2468_c0_g1_i8.p1 TRINITY_DN2468_c0_g1~~TRINITY_DN2468_c0_g1_i8.p1  ORF type:complete len:223 (+),score=24.97 TRINITY_DN2468_c0_g1_i8:106-774(+)